MKRTLTAAVIAGLTATTSLAADLPARVYTKAPVVAPAYNWTGFYVGLNVGYGFNDPTVTVTPNDPATPFIFSAIPPASYNVKGILGGAQIGYNWQLSPKWLIGLEADFQGSDVKGGALSAFNASIIPFLENARQNVQWFGTVRARAGVLATEKLFVFATGGLAYGSVHDSLTMARNTSVGGAFSTSGGFSFTCLPAVVARGEPCFAGSRTKIQAGYTVGGGFEYAAWQNVSFKVEYLYVNLGESDVTSSALFLAIPGNLPATINGHFSDLDFHVGRVGLNYRF